MQDSESGHDKRVVIIGAGCAGAYAAWRLSRDARYAGFDIRVYDLLPRVGGRLVSKWMSELDSTGDSASIDKPQLAKFQYVRNGFPQDGLLVWTLSPEKLPSPAQLALVVQNERIPLGQPFDPMALRGQLLNADLQGSADTWDHRSDTTGDTSGSDPTGSDPTGSEPSTSNDPAPTETGN